MYLHFQKIKGLSGLKYGLVDKHLARLNYFSPLPHQHIPIHICWIRGYAEAIATTDLHYAASIHFHLVRVYDGSIGITDLHRLHETKQFCLLSPFPFFPLFSLVLAIFYKCAPILVCVEQGERAEHDQQHPEIN